MFYAQTRSLPQALLQLLCIGGSVTRLQREDKTLYVRCLQWPDLYLCKREISRSSFNTLFSAWKKRDASETTFSPSTNSVFPYFSVRAAKATTTSAATLGLISLSISLAFRVPHSCLLSGCIRSCCCWRECLFCVCSLLLSPFPPVRPSAHPS